MHPRTKLRETIFEAVRAAFPSIKVSQERDLPYKTDMLPALDIKSREDEFDSAVNVKQSRFQRNLSVQFVFTVVKNDQSETNHQEIAEVERILWEVEKLMQNSESIDEEIYGLEFLGLQIIVDQDVSPGIIRGALSYTMKYAPFIK